MGATVRDVVNSLSAGTVTTDQAIAQLSAIEWARQPVTHDGYDPEPTDPNSWREVEIARAAGRLSPSDFDALLAAKMEDWA